MKIEGSSLDGIPLPWWVNCIAEAAGIDAAMTLCLENGGQRIFIPEKAKGSVLEGIVGEEAASKISAKFGGERFQIPIARNPLIFWLRDKGLSQERIAAKVRMSRRGVQYVLSGRVRKRDQQPD